MNFPMNREQRRRAKEHMERESAKYGEAFMDLGLPPVNAPEGLLRARRNKHFLVQEYAPTPESMDMVLVRLSINRIVLNDKGDRWGDGIVWDELQKIKNALGYDQFDAVEVYPRAKDLVCAANMRHLWVLTGLLPFAWRAR